MSDLKQKHLQEIDHRRTEIKKISNHNIDALIEIQDLLNNNQIKEAKQALEVLSYKIQNMKEYPFCSIPIINVILSEKQKQCVKYDIHFEANIILPQRGKIKQIDLCNIFSHLLDYAIDVCQKSNADFNKRYILLETGVFGKYLVIKCENHADKIDEGDVLEQKLLKDIAKRYNGNFYVEYDLEKKQYYAQVTLHFR